LLVRTAHRAECTKGTRNGSWLLQSSTLTLRWMRRYRCFTWITLSTYIYAQCNPSKTPKKRRSIF
jgi:hypothetical protein